MLMEKLKDKQIRALAICLLMHHHKKTKETNKPTGLYTAHLNSDLQGKIKLGRKT